MTRHIRNGIGAVRPYVYGPPELLDFVQRMFGAEVVERSPDGGEVELRVGDSMIALSLGERFPDGAGTRGAIQVYVEDADATYARALDAGATAIAAPEDKPYRDRAGGVRDVFGNSWWISTYLGGRVTEALVIGAGVSGLTTALCLAEAGHSVRIRTAALPLQTTSRAAGAMWGSTFAGPADKVEGWAATSLAAFRELARDPASGVAIASGTLASTGGAAPPPQMFPGVEVRRSEPPAGYVAGFRVTLPLIDMPRYLDHLATRVEAARIPIELRPVESLAQAADEAPVVVNCAGVGARDLVPDPALRSVRGQHVVVENPGLDEFFMTEPFGPAWTSLFPHGERLILGSVAQEDDWDTEPRTEDVEAILERCAAREPRVRDAHILEHQVGLRPMRDVVRVEAQTLGGARLVHNYGHGGTGVGLSWGCARDVVALVAA